MSRRDKWQSLRIDSCLSLSGRFTRSEKKAEVKHSSDAWKRNWSWIRRMTVMGERNHVRGGNSMHACCKTRVLCTRGWKVRRKGQHGNSFSLSPCASLLGYLSPPFTRRVSLLFFSFIAFHLSAPTERNDTQTCTSAEWVPYFIEPLLTQLQ